MKPMPLMPRTILSCLLLAAAGYAGAAEEGGSVLVVHQTYNVTRVNKDGECKDVRQVLYMTKDGIRIDEFDGTGSSETPSETTLINLKTETVVRIVQEDGARMKITQSFFDRRLRMDEMKNKAEEDIKAHPKGKGRDELERFHRAILAPKKDLRLARDETEAKAFEGARVPATVVTDKEIKDRPAIRAWLNPKVELPYDSAEVLYLLQLTGKGTKFFLEEHKDEFRFLPMEMEMRLPAGGYLHTRVTQVERRPRADVTTSLRQQMGANADFDNDYLVVSAKIEEKPVRVPPVPNTTSATTVDPD